jgi:outer membrane protein assembly factor BamE (lipoprotein component of BamABCDE complex)
MSVLVLAAALSATALVPLSAASKNVPAIAYPVNIVRVGLDDNQIKVGSTRDAVRRLMGNPHQRPTPDVWLYWNYRSDADRPNQQGCGTLIVTFSGDKVSDLKLANRRAVGLITSSARAQRSVLVAKK